MENKKVILGTVSAVAVAVGSFTYDLFKPVIQDQLKQHAPEMVKDTLGKTIGNSASSPAPEAQEAGSANPETAFKQAYDECHTATGNNPQIDLKDETAVHRADLACLIVQKNQGAYLDQLAASDADLQQTLQEVRADLSPTQKDKP